MPHTSSTAGSRRPPRSRPTVARALAVLSAALFAAGGALTHAALSEPPPTRPAERSAELPLQPVAPASAGGSKWVA